MSLSKAKSTNSIIPRNRRTDVNLQNLRSLCTGMVVNCTKSTNDDHAVHSECIPYFMRLRVVVFEYRCTKYTVRTHRQGQRKISQI